MMGSTSMEARLAGQTDLAGFRSEARQLLAHQVPPEDVQWQLEAPTDQYCDPQSPQSSRPRNVARAATAIVPASFTRLCEFVVLHREPARFSLLYRLLWRLVHEPGLRNDAADADMQQAQATKTLPGEEPTRAQSLFLGKTLDKPMSGPEGRP